MTSLSALIYLPRSIGLSANGIFAGIVLTMNLVNVPAIRDSNDHLPSFIRTYKNVTKLAIASILVGTAANAVYYYKTQETRFLYLTILSFISIPWTIPFIGPVNNRLFALERSGSEYDRRKANNLVAKWGRLNSFRTIAGFAAFLVNILYK